MNNGINLQNCTIQSVIKENSDAGLRWDVLRLDQVHPVISGNKYFKLKFYIENAKKLGKKGLLTFGGAWSNHILATAAAAAGEGLKSIGIIRGEMPEEPSSTLMDAASLGMDLRFVDRSAYRENSKTEHFGLPIYETGYLTVPEGGHGAAGVSGAAEIMNFKGISHYNLIFCACGTGTTLAGLISRASPGQQCIGIPVLKNAYSLKNEIQAILPDHAIGKRWELIEDYHFGGYARRNEMLISFMNEFYEHHGIPTDFVYTGKLMYAINDLVINNFFPEGSKILALHSGGLQGNRSLKRGLLSF
ncbi:1-aminocyclopropane-1-carboxylate deaminase/D-cysteine desulfhydrase [Pollutibacter soli]|uniref:1-aminocyclopropane-1-carboxylate deaminase/D-cysteine desulfhydrase n=1 Tax=Pollutibacter soli TaxID=3034157 RepID=UPI003013498D